MTILPRFFRTYLIALVPLAFSSAALAQNTVAVDKTSYTVLENVGSVSVLVRATRASGNQDTIKVDYTTVDGSATHGSDYTQQAGTLTFAPNETVKAVQIPIIDDLEPEGQEQFSFQLANPQGATISQGTATITINDNDGSRATISFSSATYQVNETAGTVTVTVTRSGDISQEDAVDFFTEPVTATEWEAPPDDPAATPPPGADYQATFGTLVFPAGDPAPQSFDVPIFDDFLVEGNETFAVNLSQIPGDTYDLGTSSATVTIIDNETSTVSFSSSNYQVAENAGSATLTLVRSGNTNTAVRVNVVTVAGTAEADRDYVTTVRSVDFAQGQTSATFEIPILQDQEVEGSESFQVSLSAQQSSGAVIGSPGVATVEIIDDEAANTVEFLGLDYSVNENAPSGLATVTVRLNRNGDPNQTVTVQYFTETGSATPNQDYTPISSASNTRITFAPGETIRSFTIPITNDATAENTETIGLVLANPTNAFLGANPTATLSILDDDSAGVVQFSSAAYGVFETAGSVTLTVLLNRTGNTNAPVTVNYTTVAGSAGTDRFVPKSGTVSFAPGTAVGTITIPILNDSTVEPPQSFSVVLTSSSNASLGSPSSATVTIQDDDGINSVEFDAAAYGAVEGDDQGAVLRVRAVRGGDPNQVLTVDLVFGAPGDTATTPDDYTPPASTTITFPAGVSVQTVVVPIVNRPGPQSSRTFTATLSNPGPFTTIGRQASAVVTIFDDSGPNTVQFVTKSSRFIEGEQAAIAVQVVRYGHFTQDQEGTTVDFTTEVRTGDTAQAGVNFITTSGTLTFKASVVTGVVVDVEREKDIIIPIPNNTLIQGDVTFHVTLTNTNNAEFGNISTSLVTIGDDDLGNVVRFSSSTFSTSESGGNAVLTVSLVQNGDASKATSVDFSATPITAFGGFDFSPVTGTLTFAPGETSKTILIPINNDSISEDPETFRVTLSNPSPGAIIGAPGSAVVTIIDDDVSSTIQFSPSNYTVSELGGSVTVTAVVNRQGNPNNVLTVQYQTFGGTATEGVDYVGTSGTLTFGPGQTQNTITLQILNDNLIESTENFSVVLSNPSGGASVGAGTAATIDIIDDDSPNASIGFSAPTYNVDEGAGFANLTVTRSGGLGVSATVNFATTDGTAKAGTNYQETSGSVTFAVGEVSKVIQIPIIDDPTADPTLTFIVTLTSPSGTGFVGGQSTATVNIIDNDATVFRFNPSEYTVDEGAGTVTLIVEAVRVGDPNEEITVDFVTADGTATEGVKYQRVSGRLTFGAGVTRQNITVPIIDESAKEGTQNFFVNLSNPQGSETGTAPRLGAASTATVTIIDNDATTFQFSSGNYTVQNSAGAAVVTVTLSRLSNPNGTFTVDYSTSDITATAGTDYTPVAGTLTFAAGETSKTISIPLTPEDAGQPSRQFRVTLSNPTGGAELGQLSQTVVTITNFDLSTKLMNISTRGPVRSGEEVMIAGFIVQGDSPKQVVLRGIGPSLTQRGVPNAVQDPTLTLVDMNGAQLAFNDDFAANTAADQQILTTNSLTPTDSRESALVAALGPGAYTGILRGKSNGVGLIEVYDLSATLTTRLVNISTRGKVEEGDNGAMIAGFIVGAPQNMPGVAQRVAIRAIGASLKDHGVSEALSDPTLEIYRGSTKILENDNWKVQKSAGVGDKADIEASGLQPTNDKEAVILTTLDPGSYTAVIRGKGDATGVALAEVYQLQ